MTSFFIVLLTISTCLATIHAEAREQNRVLIVGAGIAAAELALELSRNEIPFLIVEATDRVGGRMRNERLGPDGPLVELGANWMQGFRPGVPFFDFVVREVHLESTVTDFDDVYFIQNGTFVPDNIADPVWGVADKALRKVYRLGKNRKYPRIGPMDVRSGAEFAAGFKPATPIEIAAWRFSIDYEYAVPDDNIGLPDLSPIYAPDAPKSEDVFISDQRGFKAAIEIMLNKAGIHDTTKSSDKLRLSSPVRTIRYNKRGLGAQVVLRDGSTFEGAAVVSTVPLGVLKHSLLNYPPDDNRLTFDPPLRMEKRAAISKMLMGDYLKVFVQFHSPIFTAKDPLYMIPLTCDEEAGFINIHNLNKPGYFPDLNAVLVTSTDAYSRELMCEDGEKVIADVLRYVSIAAGRKLNRSEVKAYVVPKFRRDEFFRGSWSIVTPSMTKRDTHHLNEPVGSLFFAGEAHNEEGLNGYVHGAWDTGFLTSQQVISHLWMFQGGWLRRNVYPALVKFRVRASTLYRNDPSNNTQMVVPVFIVIAALCLYGSHRISALRSKYTTIR